MAKKQIEIELDVKGNVVATTANLRALKQQLKETAAGSDEFKKIYNQIDDLEDKLKSAKGASSDWIDTLENAGGPLGMLGAGLNKVKVATQSFGAAFKAIGIGALVSLIGGLVAAFSQTEGSMKKFEPLLIAMEQIFGGIIEALQPVIDGFIELAIDVMPTITKVFRFAYSSITAVFQSLGKLGGAIVKLFKGDFKGAWEDAKSSVTGFVDRFEDAEQRFDEGAKKMTKTQKKNLEEQKAAREKALQDKLKQMEADDKIDEAKLNKAKADAMALAKTEQEKLDVEIAFSKKSYDLKKKDLEEKQKLYAKDTLEYKQYTEQLINLETEYTNTKTANQEKQRQIDLQKQKEFFQKEKQNYQKKYEDNLRDTETANEKELQALDLKLKNGEIKEYEYQTRAYEIRKNQFEKRINQLNFQEMSEKLHYDNLYRMNKISKEDYENELTEIAKKYGDKRLETLKLQGQNEFNYAVDLAKMLVETKQFEKESIIALEEAKINAVATLGNILSQLAGKNKSIAVLGLLISQGAAIADILTKYARTKAELGLAKATYVAMIPNPLTAAIGTAGVAATTAAGAAATINMVAGLAGVAAAVAQGIAQINGGGASSSASGGGETSPNLGRNYGDGGYINGPRHAQGGVMINAEGGEAIMTRGAVTMFAPLLSALNQMGGGTSFSNGLMIRPDAPSVDQPQLQQQPMIMKTYVVSNELTTEAEKQARLKDLSTL